MTTQAFHELLCDLNPYVDEIVGADAFHRFTDLPLELRHTVYDQYFFDETRRSVTCNRWPDRHGKARIKLKTPRGKRWEKSAPFLPNLCLTSKTFGTEATSLLVGSAMCEIVTTAAASLILSKPNTSRVLGKVRKLVIRDSNKHYDHGPIFNSSYHTDHKIYQAICSVIGRQNKLYTRLLGSFSGLCELHIMFCYPRNFFKTSSTRAGHYDVELVHTHTFLTGFNIMPILDMERLEKLTLYTELPEGFRPEMFLADGHPFAIVKELGLTIKAELKELNCDVEVRVYCEN
jgi:hypothetical protein